MKQTLYLLLFAVSILGLPLRDDNDSNELPIKFSAYTGAGQKIESFSSTFVNLGDGFSLTYGVFIAKQKGAYDFSISMTHVEVEENILSVDKDGAEIVTIKNWDNSGQSATYPQLMSSSWIMELDVGDMVGLSVKEGVFSIAIL